MPDVNPKEKCNSCGITRDGHWGSHPIAVGVCTGFVSKPVTPLSLDTAQHIRDRINIASNHEANFIAALDLFHRYSPDFVHEMLNFLDFCDSVKNQPPYSFLELNVGQE